MSYGLGVKLDKPYDEVLPAVRAALSEHGFGILWEIDMAATLRDKIGAQVPPQVILGACNPPLAHRAVQAEPSIGLLLPCNVTVRESEPGQTLVEAMDPQIMVSLTGNDDMRPVADEVRDRLAQVLAQLAGRTPTAVPA